MFPKTHLSNPPPHHKHRQIHHNNNQRKQQPANNKNATKSYKPAILFPQLKKPPFSMLRQIFYLFRQILLLQYSNYPAGILLQKHPVQAV